MNHRPPPTRGMRHVALFVTDLEASEAFYVDLFGMDVEWRPDDDNVYLTSGNDNLALHRVLGDGSSGQLDHIGFFIACLLYTSPSPRDRTRSRMPSSA